MLAAVFPFPSKPRRPRGQELNHPVNNFCNEHAFSLSAAQASQQPAGLDVQVSLTELSAVMESQREEILAWLEQNSASLSLLGESPLERFILSRLEDFLAESGAQEAA